MIRKSLTLYLLALPIGLMGAVDFLFGMLSVLVFEDHEEVEFFTPAVVFLAVAYLLVQLAGKEREFRRVGFRDAVLFAVLARAAERCLSEFNAQDICNTA